MNKMEAKQNIEDFILQRGYTYKVEDIVESFLTYYKKGYYVSYTMKDCIKHLEQELEIISI